MRSLQYSSLILTNFIYNIKITYVLNNPALFKKNVNNVKIEPNHVHENTIY